MHLVGFHYKNKSYCRFNNGYFGGGEVIGSILDAVTGYPT